MESENYFNLVPSAGGSFSYGWRKMFGKAFLPLFLTVIIIALLNGPSAGFKFGEHDSMWPALLLLPLALFGLAYSFLFVPIISYGGDLIYLQAMRDEEVDLKTLFEGFRTKYLNIVLANLIVVALVMVGFLMLIIPGFIVLCRLMFVSYLVMDKNMEPMKAVEKSWHMTRGHGWTIFWMLILSFFLIIGGLILCFVGIFFSLMLINAAFAALYLAVLNQSDDENPIPILGVNER
jgi:uncharacterized membrane protein